MDPADNGSGFTIREMQLDDVEEAGNVFYDAFRADALATGIPPTFNVASPEAGCGLIGLFTSLPIYYKLVAVDSMGKLLGCAMVQTRNTYVFGVGPVFVSPKASNKGVGKALVQAIVEHAQKLNAPSIRLNTSGSSRKSFCLYANLGFRPVDCTTSFFGTIKRDAGERAASSLGISTDGIGTRKMEEADIKACADIYSKGVGYDREEDIKAMLMRWPQECWVATTENDTLVGYTTGLFLFGHAMATSEAAWVAVMSRAIKEKGGAVKCITIPGVHYPRLIIWALAAKLELMRHNWYMVIGEFQRPKDGFFWSPSIAH